MIIRYRLLALIFFSLCLVGTSNARQQMPPDSLEFAFLPAIAYNSDFGLMGGGLFNWYHYKDDLLPFNRYVQLIAIASTKGLYTFQFLIDKPKAFGTEFRITNEFYVYRFFQDTYYGIGNYSKLSDPPAGKPDYYSFKSFSFGSDNEIRYPLYKNTSGKQFDIKGVANLKYETPWDNGDDRLITIEEPLGFSGGRTFMLGAGFTWEGRNNEFRPSSGTYAASDLLLSQSIWGSSFNFTQFKFDTRSYFTFHLIKDVTVANRFYLEMTSGEVPYWKLPYVGDEETIRGYASRRFQDDNAFAFNSELRTWLFSVPSIEAEFGGTLFFDLGRSFPNSATLNDITSDLKYSFGFGGTASFFSPNFIIRGDFGFTEEDLGIYFTVGYMF